MTAVPWRYCGSTMRVVPWRYFEDGTVAVHEGGTVAEPWRHMRVVRKNGTVAVPLGWEPLVQYGGGTVAVSCGQCRSGT